MKSLQVIFRKDITNISQTKLFFTINKVILIELLAFTQ